MKPVEVDADVVKCNVRTIYWSNIRVYVWRILYSLFVHLSLSGTVVIFRLETSQIKRGSILNDFDWGFSLTLYICVDFINCKDTQWKSVCILVYIGLVNRWTERCDLGELKKGISLRGSGASSNLHSVEHKERGDGGHLQVV